MHELRFLELDLYTFVRPIVLPILTICDILFTSSHSYPWTYDPLFEGGFSPLWQHNRSEANTLSYQIFNQTQNNVKNLSYSVIDCLVAFYSKGHVRHGDYAIFKGLFNASIVALNTF